MRNNLRHGITGSIPVRASVDVTRNFKEDYEQKTAIHRVGIPHRKDKEYSKESNSIIMNKKWAL